MSYQAYTSTVVAPVQLAVALVCAAGVAACCALVGVAWVGAAWVGLAAGIVVAAVGLQQSTVRLSVGSHRIVLGQGPWGFRGRVISTDDVVQSWSASLSWPQVFGIGVGFHARTTRLTVRPGPTLCLVLATGEHIRVSTSDPDLARALLPPSPPPLRST